MSFDANFQFDSGFLSVFLVCLLAMKQEVF
jgi:hypothetical protein